MAEHATSATHDGRVESIYITSEPAGAMESRESVRAIAGSGLEGDRYASDNGTFSASKRAGQELTLIEAEAVEAACRDYDIDITAVDTRRNIVTRNVALNHLAGRRFRIGDVELEGTRLAEPCGHIRKLSGVEDITKALVHRGGLRCHVLNDGTISVGDAVVIGELSE